MTLAAARNGLRTLLNDSFIVDAELNTLIRRAELKMERELVADGEYRPRQMMAHYSGTTNAQGLQLPADYQRMRTVMMNDWVLRYASPEKIPVGSVPEDTQADLYYYKRLEPLTETTSNWLYGLAEDLYMYAGALQWVPHQRDDQRLQMWGTYYADALATVREANKSQPTGSWINQKGRPFRGLYTIEGDYVRFNAQNT